MTDLSQADSVLITRVRSGDEQAFQTLFDVYYAGLCAFAATYIKVEEMAEEVVQDVLLDVWERRARWVVSSSIKAYLYGAVRNKALDVLRRVRREDQLASQVTTGEWPLGAASARGSQLDQIMTAEVWTAIRDAVDGMPEKRRAVFLLRWDHGMSYADIASATGTSIQAVERQLVRALHSLRDALRAGRPASEG
jgi:RNA polymerase sigma-70 factor (ECF subfamily)